MTAPVSTTAVKNQGPAKTEIRSKERTRRGRAKDPTSRILELQRVVGNRAVNQLIQPGGGLPLAPDVRTFMEERFNYDFSRVRVHTDQRATAFSRSLGAQAYTVGYDIVFGAGQYDPTTVTGRALLAHELAHVVQANGQIPSRFDVTPVADATEMQAERAAAAVTHGERAQVSSGKPAAIRLRRDPRLGEVLAQIEATPLVLRDDEDTLRWIWERVRTVDYSDADNILPITEAVSNKFPHLVARFSALVERAIELNRAQHQQAMRLMQVQRRGPYGQYGPGVVLPVVANFARPLLELFQAIENLFRSAGAFVRGLCEGFSESVSEDQARQLSVRLLQSAILNIIFPPVFLSGAVVGIVEDVVDTVRGIRDLIVNFREMASAAAELIRVFFSSEGPGVARQLGHEIGKSFADRITGMLGGNIFRFTYELGKFIGPTIIYTILSFLGIPELLAASIVTRLMSILRPLLQRFPRLLRILEGIARRLPTRRRGPNVDPDIDRAVDRSFDRTFTEPVPERTPDPAEGLVGRGPLTTAQIRAARRLLLRQLDEFPILQRLWREAADPSDVARLTAANSRRLFNNHRGRFWRRVRENDEARRIFEDAGFLFPENSLRTAPVHRGVAGRQGRISLDHIVRRADDPARALDPTNLRIVVQGDNTLLENIGQAIGRRLTELGASP